MKTSEFIETVHKLGYRVGFVPSSEEELYVTGNDDNVVLLVHTKEKFVIRTDWHEFKQLDNENKEKLLSVALEYITTPIEEREEPKKYYLRLPKGYNIVNTYLNYDTECDEYVFSDKDEILGHQTKFTQEEIDNLPNQNFVKTLIKEEEE